MVWHVVGVSIGVLVNAMVLMSVAYFLLCRLALLIMLLALLMYVIFGYGAVLGI